MLRLRSARHCSSASRARSGSDLAFFLNPSSIFAIRTSPSSFSLHGRFALRSGLSLSSAKTVGRTSPSHTGKARVLHRSLSLETSLSRAPRCARPSTNLLQRSVEARGRGHPVGPHRVLVNCLSGGGNTSMMDQRCVASGSSRAGSLARRASLCTLRPFGVHRARPGFFPHGRCSHGLAPAPFTGRTAHMRRSSSAWISQEVSM